MGLSALLIGTRPITVAEPPKRSSLRSRISARLFGGTSGGVFRGMMTLALGSSIGRVIGIASIPVLTRLYSPADFGVLAVFTALVAILAPLVTLRYALALPLPRHDGVAMNLLVLSTGLMLGLSAISQWRIGGRADLVVKPENTEQVAKLMQWFGKRSIKPVVIGLTSNLLFDDAGLRVPCIIDV